MRVTWTFRRLVGTLSATSRSLLPISRKYLSKTFDAGGVGDSYRASGKALPKPVVIRSLTQTLDDAGSDLLGLLFKFYSIRTFHSAYLDCGGVYVAITP